MSTTHWAILTITQTLTATGYEIVITTDIACHLWMRWTTIEPQQHKIPILSRGLFLHTDKYFCFDVWEDNEQEEVGDTLIHTFIKEPWPSCETRYFYFHGTIAGTPSLSTTAIFEKHRIAPPYGPPETHDYPCSNHDGFLYINTAGVMADYIAAWNAATAPILANHVYLYTRNCLFAGSIRIYRSIFGFDTSAIPVGSLITDVKIGLTPALLNWACNTNICITPATTCHLPIILSDYHSLLDTPTILGSKPLAELVDETPFQLTLSADSYPEIAAGGLTKFGIRTEMEINMIPCTTGWQYVHMRACENIDPRIKPKLTVTHQPPL